jgi:hypothetical protein
VRPVGRAPCVRAHGRARPGCSLACDGAPEFDGCGRSVACSGLWHGTHLPVLDVICMLTPRVMQESTFDAAFTQEVQREMARRGGGYEALRRMRAAGDIKSYEAKHLFIVPRKQVEGQCEGFDLELGL